MVWEVRSSKITNRYELIAISEDVSEGTFQSKFGYAPNNQQQQLYRKTLLTHVYFMMPALILISSIRTSVKIVEGLRTPDYFTPNFMTALRHRNI